MWYIDFHINIGYSYAVRIVSVADGKMQFWNTEYIRGDTCLSTPTKGQQLVVTRAAVHGN